MAAGDFSTIAGLNSVPAPKKQTLESNYIDFTAQATQGWAQQYVPDLMAGEAEVFGNRTIGGFLEMVGAEEPMASDQVIWSEQGRLHLSYKGNQQRVGSTFQYLFHIVTDVDDNDVKDTAAAVALNNCAVRIGDLVLITDAADATVKGYVSAVPEAVQVGGSGAFVVKVTVDALTDDGTGLTDVSLSNTTATASLMVFGSAYGKGTVGRNSSNTPKFKSFTNRPMIMKDKYEVSGSDVSQIGWVEVTGEDGQSGYLWYLKAAGDTKSRFADYCEMAMLESELVTNSINTVGSVTPTGETSGNDITGTEGLFAALETRGHVFNGVHGAVGSSSASADDDVTADFDAIIGVFDEQGAIEEYMMFLNRTTSLRIDDWLASKSSYGSGGTSYGVFDNSEDMALNLGFSGFRRASYDFYKTDWRYLNDKSTRGGLMDTENHIRGCFVPAGVTTVYDQSLGKNLKRPFLHVRYRASNMDDRRFKTWTTGSVGAATSDLDAMEMHFLTERCLVTQGANNFILLKGTKN
jgi:hypothetical protein